MKLLSLIEHNLNMELSYQTYSCTQKVFLSPDEAKSRTLEIIQNYNTKTAVIITTFRMPLN